MKDVGRLLDGFADAVASIGTGRFDGSLLAAVNTIALIEHITVLLHRPEDGLRILAIASRTDEAQTRSLTRDYIAEHYALDPNFEDLERIGRSRKILTRRHDPSRLKTKSYQTRFYTAVGIVDKFSYLWRTGDAAYYVNLYRTARSGRFSADDIQNLSKAARLIASTVRMHSGRKRVESAFATGQPDEMIALLVSLLGEELTARERAVLSCILRGIPTEGIALDLDLKPTSVITYRKRAYAKLGIATQAELFARCLRALPRIPRASS